MKRKPTTQEIVERVRQIRANNNDLWMALLAIAIKSEPYQAKYIIREITKNDREVSKWLSRL